MLIYININQYIYIHINSPPLMLFFPVKHWDFTIPAVAAAEGPVPEIGPRDRFFLRIELHTTLDLGWLVVDNDR